MSFFSFLIRYTLDCFRDTKRIVNYFDLVKLNNIIIIPKIFFIKLFYGLSFIRNFRIKPLDINILQLSNSNLFKILPSKEIIKDIDDFGYSKAFMINENLLDSIKNEIFLNQNAEAKKKKINSAQLLKKNDESLNDYFLRLRNSKISRITGNINLNNKSSVKDLLTSDLFLKIASKYLETNKFSINAAYFLSNPLEISEQEKYSNAQYFHWDNDFSKFFKLYIYLTDVDENSGPHVYITGTHKQKFPEHSLCRLYSDESIYNKYKIHKKFTGQAGSMFLVDSYGLHKGESPTEKSRLMLNVHYGRGKILYSADDIYIKNST